MGYEVLIRELRASAGEHRKIATTLGKTPVDITATTPQPVGHVELAAWLGAIEEQIDHAHSALATGQKGLARQLTATAGDYEHTDDTAAVTLVDLLGRLQPGAPLGPVPFDPLAGLLLPPTLPHPPEDAP